MRPDSSKVLIMICTYILCYLCLNKDNGMAFMSALATSSRFLMHRNVSNVGSINGAGCSCIVHVSLHRRPGCFFIVVVFSFCLSVKLSFTKERVA